MRTARNGLLCSLRWDQVRLIRQQLPPRPAVTVLTYLDHYGNPIKNKDETDISFIRTREDKFFLQRVFPDQSVVRWSVPGLNMMKNAATLDQIAIPDIDTFGGVVVPIDVAPCQTNCRPSLGDAIFLLMHCYPNHKFIRRDRRAHRRKVVSSWEEDPDKFTIAFTGRIFIMAVSVTVLVVLIADLQYRGYTPFGDPLREDSLRENSCQGRMATFAERHPEHTRPEILPAAITRGMQQLTRARMELRDKEITDPTLMSEWYWKVKHMWNFGHWPKGLLE